ncbi:MAG: hypothetical protein Q8P17_01580 [bacterium]|nr:hypothetical protein [bacterium]
MNPIRNSKLDMNSKTKFISNGARKILLTSALLLAVPVVALAQGFVPLAPIPGLTDTQYAPNGLAAFFNNLYKFAIGIAAALAVIQIIWAGLEIAIFQKDSVSAITDNKGKIYNAIFGLVLVLSPVLVFSIINPSILNLSLNLPALDTRSSAPASQTTQTYTLSNTEQQLRESGGGTVSSSFTADPNASPRTLGQILDTKQTECSGATGGLGVVLPGTETGGGVLHYVCQTCPPNTTPTLFAKGIVGSGARGACQAK